MSFKLLTAAEENLVLNFSSRLLSPKFSISDSSKVKTVAKVVKDEMDALSAKKEGNVAKLRWEWMIQKPHPIVLFALYQFC